MKNCNRKYIAIALSVTLLAGLTVGCSSRNDAEEVSTAIHVDTQTAERGTLNITGNYIGTLSPNDSVNVTPMVSGTVTEVNVQVGDTVSEGDVLVQFDDTAAELSVESAENAVATAEASKNAAAEQKDIASEQTGASIDTLQDTLNAYNDSLKTAQDQLKDLRKSRKSLKSAMDQAQTAYSGAKQLYKTAQTLYVNYKSFLNSNVDCQTTAGLTAASTTTGTDAAATTKASTASALLKSLNSAGLTVEYLSDSGLTALQESSDEAEAAYNTASGAYAEASSGIETLKSSIDQLETQIKSTQKSIDSTKKTQSMTAGTSDDVYDAQINSAEIGVESAEYQQDLYTVTAPISGVVEAVNAVENEMFATGMPVVTISSKDTMLVTFYVTDEVHDFLNTGDSVTVEDNGDTYRGTISSIGTAVDSTKGLFKVEAQLFVGSDSNLSTGVSVSLSVVNAAVTDGILIPYDAVYYENNQAYVYCIQDGTAVRVDVTTGLYDNDTIVIESGIEAGDEVVVSWASGLKDGAEIAGEETEDAAENDAEE